MVTKNDVTGDEIKSRATSDAYRESPFWDNIKRIQRSCTCFTKTNDPDAHDESCGYRTLMEKDS